LIKNEGKDNCSTNSLWMDEKTRKYALQKLEKISKNVGFPDWILSNKELDEFYQLVSTNCFLISIQFNVHILLLIGI